MRDTEENQKLLADNPTISYPFTTEISNTNTNPNVNANLNSRASRKIHKIASKNTDSELYKILSDYPFYDSRDKIKKYLKVNDLKKTTTSVTDAKNNYNLKLVSQGLPNLGNTCFMNSIIQCIAHFSSFFQFFQNACLKSSYSKSLKALISCLRFSSDPSKKAVCFNNESIRASGYGNGEQKDSKEFYCFILETLLRESPSIRETCILQKSEIYSFNECKCSNSITTKYPFIPLVVPSGKYWIDELQDFLKEQETAGSLYCVDCKVNFMGKIKTTFIYPKIIPVYFYEPTLIELGSVLVLWKTSDSGGDYKLRPGGTSGKIRMNRVKHQVDGNRSSKLEYIVEACVVRSGSSRQFGHYWARTLEKKQIVDYNDSSVSTGSNKSCLAYMTFLGVKQKN